MSFAVKTEVLKKAFEDPETSRKLDEAVMKDWTFQK